MIYAATVKYLERLERLIFGQDIIDIRSGITNIRKDRIYKFNGEYYRSIIDLNLSGELEYADPRIFYKLKLYEASSTLSRLELPTTFLHNNKNYIQDLSYFPVWMDERSKFYLRTINVSDKYTNIRKDMSYLLEEKDDPNKPNVKSLYKSSKYTINDEGKLLDANGKEIRDEYVVDKVPKSNIINDGGQQFRIITEDVIVSETVKMQRPIYRKKQRQSSCGFFCFLAGAILGAVVTVITAGAALPAVIGAAAGGVIGGALGAGGSVPDGYELDHIEYYDEVRQKTVKKRFKVFNDGRKEEVNAEATFTTGRYDLESELDYKAPDIKKNQTTPLTYNGYSKYPKNYLASLYDSNRDVPMTYTFNPKDYPSFIGDDDYYYKKDIADVEQNIHFVNNGFDFFFSDIDSSNLRDYREELKSTNLPYDDYTITNMKGEVRPITMSGNRMDNIYNLYESTSKASYDDLPDRIYFIKELRGFRNDPMNVIRYKVYYVDKEHIYSTDPPFHYKYALYEEFNNAQGNYNAVNDHELYIRKFKRWLKTISLVSNTLHLDDGDPAMVAIDREITRNLDTHNIIDTDSVNHDYVFKATRIEYQIDDYDLVNPTELFGESFNQQIPAFNFKTALASSWMEIAEDFNNNNIFSYFAKAPLRKKHYDFFKDKMKGYLEIDGRRYTSIYDLPRSITPRQYLQLPTLITIIQDMPLWYSSDKEDGRGGKTIMTIHKYDLYKPDTGIYLSEEDMDGANFKNGDNAYKVYNKFNKLKYNDVITYNPYTSKIKIEDLFASYTFSSRDITSYKRQGGKPRKKALKVFHPKEFYYDYPVYQVHGYAKRTDNGEYDGVRSHERRYYTGTEGSGEPWIKYYIERNDESDDIPKILEDMLNPVTGSPYEHNDKGKRYLSYYDNYSAIYAEGLNVLSEAPTNLGGNYSPNDRDRYSDIMPISTITRYLQDHMFIPTRLKTSGVKIGLVNLNIMVYLYPTFKSNYSDTMLENMNHGDFIGKYGYSTGNIGSYTNYFQLPNNEMTKEEFSNFMNSLEKPADKDSIMNVGGIVYKRGSIKCIITISGLLAFYKPTNLIVKYDRYKSSAFWREEYSAKGKV